jgi:PAT family beta-lactamase induction signal transducer AmpG
MPAAAAPRDNPPWLFGLLAMPSGIAYWGLAALLVPYLLRKHGVHVDRIAGVVAVASIPNMWSFVAAPIVDLGLPRRVWLMLCAAITSLLSLAAVLMSAGSLPWLTVVLFMGTVAQALASSAKGGLMTSVRPIYRGRAAGFAEAGNIGAGAIGGGCMIWLADRASLPWLALSTALAIFLPALAALWIHEVPQPKLALGPAFSALFHDVKDVLSSSRTWLGLVFFLSPVGVGALGNLISSVGPDYHAPSAIVAWITGAGGGVLTAGGALIGGWICDRVHRFTAYSVFGLLSSLCAVWLYLGPSTSFTYAAGYSAYSFTNGFAYAAYSALILEVLGKRPRAAATGYSLMNSSGNVPLIYMTWLDGVGYRYGGAHGLMAMDAAASGLGGVILLWVARHFAKRWVSPAAQPSAA